MNYWVCVVHPGSPALDAALRRQYEIMPRSRGLSISWQGFGSVAVLVSGDGVGPVPLVVHDGDYVAVGEVYLDNHGEIGRLVECRDAGVSDLLLALRIVSRGGTRGLARLLGDFSFVVANHRTCSVVAASDALSVKKLYYAQPNGAIAFGSRAEALASNGQYDLQYMAELTALWAPSADRTPYAGVRQSPAGTAVIAEAGQLRTHRYWSVSDFDMRAEWAQRECEAVEICRQLLIDAVRLRLTNGVKTWAHLSGGLDSSSIVSIAQWLVETGQLSEGLAGTITYVDGQGTGTDEREYSDVIAQRWGIRNDVILDAPMWYDERFAPPLLDEPLIALGAYSRERQVCMTVRSQGGAAIVTGTGGDELFTGSMIFFADWLAQGRVVAAVREMARRAMIGRASFWDLAYRYSVAPLLPSGLSRLLGGLPKLPEWIQPTVIDQFQLDARLAAHVVGSGRRGHKYHDGTTAAVGALGKALGQGLLGETLNVRHPFLYRPLVEFALQLPPELCARPYARKWILREALRGIVPDQVRTRIGKADASTWSVSELVRHRPLLERVLQQPILADFGLIDASKLRSALANIPQAPMSLDPLYAKVQTTFTVEAWLQMRAGRWPQGVAPS